jgi:hypothetical protein
LCPCARPSAGFASVCLMMWQPTSRCPHRPSPARSTPRNQCRGQESYIVAVKLPDDDSQNGYRRGLSSLRSERRSSCSA